MKSIALTGATSMLGVALINEYIKRGVHVLAFARRGSKNMGKSPALLWFRWLSRFFVQSEECDIIIAQS